MYRDNFLNRFQSLGRAKNLTIQDERPQGPRFQQPTLHRECFELDSCNGPRQRDDRVRSNQPINLCRNLVPCVDTHLSPPMENRWPICLEGILGSNQGATATTMQTISNQFNGMSLSEDTPMANCSGYIVCGKSVSQK